MKKETARYKISPKGKRKLDFPKWKSSVKLPLIGKTIYLDVKELKHVKRLQADLKKLGGTLEEFVSKDINYLITSQPCPRSKRGHGDQGPELGPTPSPFSYDPSPSPSNPDNKKVATTNTLLDNAEKWGVKIVPLEAAYRWIEKELRKLPRSSHHTDKAQQKTKSVTSYTTFKAPFVKFEASNYAHRPMHSQLDTWPRLNVDTPRGSCPFDGTMIDKGDHSNEERGEYLAAQVDIVTPNTPREEKDKLESGADTKTLKKSDTDIFEGSVILTAGEVRRRREQKRRLERKRGYCECCYVKYEDLDKHVRDDQHHAYVWNKSNYSDLDIVIDCVPSTADFITKYFMTSLAEKSQAKRTSEDSQLEEIVLIPITPAKTEKKIMSPKCSKKSANKTGEMNKLLSDAKENVGDKQKYKVSPKVVNETAAKITSPKCSKKSANNTGEMDELLKDTKQNVGGKQKYIVSPKVVKETAEKALDKCEVNDEMSDSMRLTRNRALLPSKQSENVGPAIGSPVESRGSTETVEKIRINKGRVLTFSSPTKVKNVDVADMPEKRTTSGKSLLSSPHELSKATDVACLSVERARSSREKLLFSSHKIGKETNEHDESLSLEERTQDETLSSRKVLRSRNATDGIKDMKDSHENKKMSKISPCRNTSHIISPTKSRVLRSPVASVAANNENKMLSPTKKQKSHVGENYVANSSPRSKSAVSESISPRTSKIRLRRLSLSPHNSNKVNSTKEFNRESQSVEDTDRKNRNRKSKPTTGHVTTTDVSSSVKSVAVLSTVDVRPIRQSPRKRLSRTVLENKVPYSNDFALVSDSNVSVDVIGTEGTERQLTRVPDVSPAENDDDLTIPTNAMQSTNGDGSVRKVAGTSEINMQPLISTGQAQANNNRSSGDFEKCILVAMTSGDIPVDQDRLKNNCELPGKNNGVDSTSGFRSDDKQSRQLNLEQAKIIDTNVPDNCKAENSSAIPEQNNTSDKSPLKKMVRNRNKETDEVENNVNNTCTEDSNKSYMIETSVPNRSLRNTSTCIVNTDGNKPVILPQSLVKHKNSDKKSLKKTDRLARIVKSPSKHSRSDKLNRATAVCSKSIVSATCPSPDKNDVPNTNVKSPVQTNDEQGSSKENSQTCKPVKSKCLNKAVRKPKITKGTVTSSDYGIPSNTANIPSDMLYLFEGESPMFTKSLAERVKERQASRRTSVDTYNLNVLSQSPQRSRSNSFSSTKSDSSTTRTDKNINAVEGKLKKLAESTISDKTIGCNTMSKRENSEQDKFSKSVISKKLNGKGVMTHVESCVVEEAGLGEKHLSSLKEMRNNTRHKHAKRTQNTHTRTTMEMPNTDNSCKSNYTYTTTSNNKKNYNRLINDDNVSGSDSITRQTRSSVTPVVLGKLMLSSEEIQNEDNTESSDIEFKRETRADRHQALRHMNKRAALQRKLERLSKKYNCHEAVIASKPSLRVKPVTPKCAKNSLKYNNKDFNEKQTLVKPNVKCSNPDKGDDMPEVLSSHTDHENSQKVRNNTISNFQNEKDNFKDTTVSIEDKARYSSTESLSSECSTGRRSMVKLRRCKSAAVRSDKQNTGADNLKETKTFIEREMRKLNEVVAIVRSLGKDCATSTMSTSQSQASHYSTLSPSRQLSRIHTCSLVDKNHSDVEDLDNPMEYSSQQKPVSPCKENAIVTNISSKHQSSIRHCSFQSMSPQRKRKFVKDYDDDKRSASPTFTCSKSAIISTKQSRNSGRSASPVFQKSPLSKRLKENEDKSENRIHDEISENSSHKSDGKIHMSTGSSQECKQNRVRISRSTRDSVATQSEKVQSNNYPSVDHNVNRGKQEKLKLTKPGNRQNKNKDGDIGGVTDEVSNASQGTECSSLALTPTHKIKITSPKSGYSSTPRESRRRNWKRKTSDLSSQGGSEASVSSQHARKKIKLEKLKYDISDASCKKSTRSKLNLENKIEKVDHAKLTDESRENNGDVLSDSTIKENDSHDANNAAVERMCRAGNSSFTLKWDPVSVDDSKKQVVKLNKSWSLLSERSVAKLLSSDDDRESFDGFTKHEVSAESLLPSDLSYEEKEEIEFDSSSEHEWVVEQNCCEENKGNAEKHEFKSLLPSTFSSPGKLSDSSWIEACDLYINKSLKETENTSVEELNTSCHKNVTASDAGIVRRSPRKNPTFFGNVKEADCEHGEYISPRHSRHTTPKKKRDEQIGEEIFDRETVDQEIEFNYRSPQKYRNDFSPLRVCKGRVVSSPNRDKSNIRTSTPSRTRRSLEEKSRKAKTFLSLGDEISSSDKKLEAEKRLLKKVSTTHKTFSLEYDKLPTSKKKGRSRKEKQSL